MYGDDLIAYVESREQSLASTSYTHDAPPINAAHASGIPNTQLLGVVEEVFVHAWADIVQEGIVQRWTRKVASAFTTSVTRMSSLGRDSLVGVSDSVSNVAEDTDASSSSSSALAPSHECSMASTAPSHECSIASTAPLFIPNAEMAMVRGTSSTWMRCRACLILHPCPTSHSCWEWQNVYYIHLMWCLHSLLNL